MSKTPTTASAKSDWRSRLDVIESQYHDMFPNLTSASGNQGNHESFAFSPTAAASTGGGTAASMIDINDLENPSSSFQAFIKRGKSVPFPSTEHMELLPLLEKSQFEIPPDFNLPNILNDIHKQSQSR